MVLVTPDTKMHSTNFRLSRRQFLARFCGILTGLAGWPLLLSSDTFEPLLYAEMPLPVWWLSLADGKFHEPPGMPMAYGMPGSVMKLVATAALSEEGLISSNERLECKGVYQIKNHRYRCQHAHGSLTIREALGASCNVFFAQAVDGLSARRFLDYARYFWLHQLTAPGEVFRFPKGDLSWDVRSYALGLNMDFQPNARQLLRLGKLIALRGIPGFKLQTWQWLQEGMRFAAHQGTAAGIDPGNRLHIAAKTGTVPHGLNYDGWVIGYFPYDNPRYVFCARAQAGTAKESAVPLAQRFLASRSWP
jgi:penicillin-binding protein 2